jgi:uncharacterized protein YbcC (UPF0753/DUF2309 family)
MEKLRLAIEHAAHFLPAQGPITGFVHHNTLHAFEHLPFEQAVRKGAELFGCNPYLSEDEYRARFQQGQFRQDDIAAVLMDDLGDEGDELLGFLGTRFHLRMGMLAHRLRSGPGVELDWVVAETDALKRFRDDAKTSMKTQLIQLTRHWVMRDLFKRGASHHHDRRIPAIAGELLQQFGGAANQDSDATNWESVCLHLLWRICEDGVRQLPDQPQRVFRAVRHRDWLLAVTGLDSDELVHNVLIQFTAAFLDQGFANWQLPDRSSYFRSFAAQYGLACGPPDSWMGQLSGELARIAREQLTPTDTIAESLELLGISEAEQEAFITQTLLALRGFAGMLWQIEQRGDRVVHSISSGSLIEFLAVRLLLDRLAIAHVAQVVLGYEGQLASLRSTIEPCLPYPPTNIPQRAFLLFQLAQLLGWTPETLYRLSDREWATLVTEVEAFSGLDRRRIFHLAFERRYRIQALDAVIAHHRALKSCRKDSDLRATFQFVCCIDEREESFRRHLEEVSPGCETFSTAGFYAVAMYYRGAAEAHFTPLCPVIIKPAHYVTENAVYTLHDSEKRRRKGRRAIGAVNQHIHRSSRTLVGGWLAGVLGSLASIPLVARVLFPRATARIRHRFGSLVRPPAITRLQLERSENDPGPGTGHVGYRVDEMASIVERVLRDVGSTQNLSPLVFVCGHGSSSLNNPHESAHDCGACAGNRGGPNARAFAQMANRVDVRQLVSLNGISIPRDTVFVGAYHNTCDDSMTYFDLDSLPASHKQLFERARADVDEARQRSALERCRRFESARLDLDPPRALQHVEGRSEDLSQVRPEYGHATNALCFVGRRAWSRGLFLDRRAFLQSYDPEQDDENSTILSRILQAVIPVCAGISLEYYFSYVDPAGYGCGTKLPHNVTSLLGVMDGAASDLRPGLPWQMVEIHDPVRLLFLIETTPDAMEQIIQRNPGIAQLVQGHWVQLATFDDRTSQVHLYCDKQFMPYVPESGELPEVESSADWYRGWRDNLGYARIRRGCAVLEVCRD